MLKSAFLKLPEGRSQNDEALEHAITRAEIAAVETVNLRSIYAGKEAGGSDPRWPEEA